MPLIDLSLFDQAPRPAAADLSNGQTQIIFETERAAIAAANRPAHMASAEQSGSRSRSYDRSDRDRLRRRSGDGAAGRRQDPMSIHRAL